MAEAAGEVVGAGIVQQARAAVQQPHQHRTHRVGVGEHPAEERQDADDVGPGRPIRLARPRHRLAEEYPQRLRGVERLPPRRPAAPDAALLIERQQAAEQVHVAVLVLRTVRQVGDRVVLAVAVLVELPVGVVEDQALAVGMQEIRILATHHLVERGGVLECETAARQLPPTLAPDPARRPQVPLVDQHEVVVAEMRHRDALDALLLRQLVQVDDLDRLEQIGAGLAGEQPRMDSARVQLALVLRRHLLVRRQQHDVVQPPSRPAQVVPVLQDVRVHEERLARTRGTLERQDTQVVRRVLRHREHLPLHLPRHVQVRPQRFRLIEIPPQVVLREQQGEVLVRLPGAAVIRRHPQPHAEGRDVRVVLGEPLVGHPCARRVHVERARVLALTGDGKGRRHPPQCVQHVLHAEMAELPAHECVQDQPTIESGHRLPHFHPPARRCSTRTHSSNISFRKAGSVLSAAHVSPGRRMAFRVWSPFT